MNYLKNARNLFLTAAKNLEVLNGARTDFLEGVAKHFSAARRTKLKPGFHKITERLDLCVAPTADVLLGSSETAPLQIEVEGCEWFTLESDISISDHSEALVLEADIDADIALVADVFLRAFDDKGQSTDLTSQAWTLHVDGLCAHLMTFAQAAKSAQRVRLIIHFRQPNGQIGIRQLAAYVV